MKYEDESAIAVREGQREYLHSGTPEGIVLNSSRVTVMPEAVSVGEEANVTFEIYNLGKDKVIQMSVQGLRTWFIANAEVLWET